MTRQTALGLYQQLVEAINRAAADKNIYDVPKAAEQAGMEGGEIKNTGFSQRWEYSFTDASGQTVNVQCRWYDQSKTFSVQPDMHIMTIELAGSDPQKRSASYEE